MSRCGGGVGGGGRGGRSVGGAVEGLREYYQGMV